MATKRNTRKFKKGRQIKSLNALIRQVYIIHQIGPREFTRHYGWFQSWQLHYAMAQILKGRIYAAKEVGK